MNLSIETLIYIHDVVGAINLSIPILIALIVLSLWASLITEFISEYPKTMVCFISLLGLICVSIGIFVPKPEFVRMIIEQKMQGLSEADKAIVSKKLGDKK